MNTKQTPNALHISPHQIGGASRHAVPKKVHHSHATRRVKQYYFAAKSYEHRTGNREEKYIFYQFSISHLSVQYRVTRESRWNDAIFDFPLPPQRIELHAPLRRLSSVSLLKYSEEMWFNDAAKVLLSSSYAAIVAASIQHGRLCRVSGITWNEIKY